MKVSAGQVVQDFAGAVEVGEEFFFLAEFAGVGDQAAAGAAGGVLDVQHLMIQDVLHGASRDSGAVHAAIEQDVIGAGVVTAELAAPTAGAPADVRAGEFSFEEFIV